MNVYKKFRKFKKNAKALSPVIATIILIAVTVAVSVVVAAWMGGLTLGFMGNAESASITQATFTNATSVSVTVQNTGSSTVTIKSGNIAGFTNAVSVSGATAIAKGQTGVVVLTLGGSDTFSSTAQYQITLTTAKGNTIAYTATYAP
jgi:flagellin-like protein